MTVTRSSYWLARYNYTYVGSKKKKKKEGTPKIRWSCALAWFASSSITTANFFLKIYFDIYIFHFFFFCQWWPSRLASRLGTPPLSPQLPSSRPTLRRRWRRHRRRRRARSIDVHPSIVGGGTDGETPPTWNPWIVATLDTINFRFLLPVPLFGWLGEWGVMQLYS